MSTFLRPALRLSSQLHQRSFRASTRRMASKQEWLVILPDHAGVLEKRMEVRPKHLEAINPRVEKGSVVMGGAMLDEEAGMKPKGSVMMVCADTKEEVVKMIESDIYVESKVWDLSQMQVIPFRSAVRTAL